MGQTKSKIKSKKELLKIHNHRRRKIVGCMSCYKEIQPDSRDISIIDGKEICSKAETLIRLKESFGWLCGTCREEYWFCQECYEKKKKNFEHKKGHLLFKEPVDLYVDVSEIEYFCDEKNGFTGAECIRACFHAFRRRWLLGERNEKSKTYAWQTYASVYEEACSLFCACRDIYKIPSLVPGEDLSEDAIQKMYKNKSNDLPFCILVGASSRIFYIVYFAMLLFGVPLVPMPGSTTIDQLKYVSSKVKPKIIFSSVQIDIPDCEELRNCGIVWMEDSLLRYEHIRKVKKENENVIKRNVENDTKQRNFSDLVSHGRKYMKENEEKLKKFDLNFNLKKKKKRKAKKENNEAVKLLLSSSGTTGVPKLIMVSDLNIKNGCSPPKRGILTVMFSIKPLRQVFDLVSKGGRVGIFTSITDISSDLKLVRPTILGSTPAFFLNLYKDYEIVLKQRLIQKAKELKVKSIKDIKSPDVKEIKSILSTEWIQKGVIGNRCTFVIIGGAVTSKELVSWVFSSLGAVAIDGYGSTETGAISSQGKVLEGIKMILLDAPQYGYMTTDEPNARGEIIVNTPGMTKGYFGDPDATKKQFINIGGIQYSRTGDIGEIVNGKIIIIDRIKSLFKLRTGVFVAPSPIEVIFQNSTLVKSVFIWGTSQMSNVCAAVVISKEIKKKKKEEKEEEEEEEEEGEGEVNDGEKEVEEIKKRIRNEFVRLAESNGLKPEHVPKYIVLDYNQWTVEEGLINNAGKPIRAALQRKYKDLILAEVEKHEKHKNNEEIVIDNEENNAKKVSSSTNQYESDLLSGLVKIISDCVPSFDKKMINSKQSLFELGADSLAFARIVGGIRRRFNSSVTMQQLMGCKTLGEVQKLMFGVEIDADKHGNNKKSGSVFWESEVKLAIEKLEKIAKNIEKIKIEKKVRKDKPLMVLLTGGRGYVGSFLLSELCKRGARVLCVVRSKKCVNSSRDSICSVLKKYNLNEYSIEKWDSIEGDISKNNFGLSDNDITSKCLKLSGAKYPDLILHCAAAVGSSYPYASLKPHNVDGTIHACSIAYKFDSHLLHVSTVGFLHSDCKNPTKEKISSDILDIVGTYAQSKWVSERVVLMNSVLLKKKVSIVRVGTCFGSKESGAANVNDSVIRLIVGLSKEGIYCDGKDSPLPSMFRLAPVDWVAWKIVEDHIGSNINQIKPVSRITCAMATKETSLNQIIDALKNCGVTLKNVKSKEFRERMKEIANNEEKYIKHPLFVYSSTLASSGFSVDNDSSLQKKKKEKKNQKSDPNIEATVRWLIKQNIIVKKEN